MGGSIAKPMFLEPASERYSSRVRKLLAVPNCSIFMVDMIRVQLFWQTFFL